MQEVNIIPLHWDQSVSFKNMKSNSVAWVQERTTSTELKQDYEYSTKMDHKELECGYENWH
jgi:hypothetical protein